MYNRLHKTELETGFVICFVMATHYFLVGTATQTAAIYIDRYKSYVTLCEILTIITRGQSNLTKSDSRGAHSPVRGHPRGSKVVPLNSWGRVSY